MVDHVVGVRPVHRADEESAARLRRRPRRQPGIRGFFRASAPGGRQPVEESALSAEAPRSGNPRETLPGRDGHPPGSRLSAGPAGLVPGERGAAGTPQQSAGTENRRAAARRLQSDSLSGTARAVHGFHLQPDRQIALDHRLRQRRRVDQRPVQCGVAGDRRERRAGFGDRDRIRGIHHVGRIHRSEVPRGSRQQHAGAGTVVPHAGERARPEVPD